MNFLSTNLCWGTRSARLGAEFLSNPSSYLTSLNLLLQVATLDCPGCVCRPACHSVLAGSISAHFHVACHGCLLILLNSINFGTVFILTLTICVCNNFMDHLKEVQWSEIRLMARQGLRHCEILRELWRLHDGHALSSTMVHRWMTATFTGRRNFTTTKPTGRPPKLTPAVLRAIKVATRAEPTITIWQLTHQFDLGQATVHKALRSVLKLRKRLCIFRLHNLTAANRRKRLQISRRLLGRMRHSPRWSSKVITADESWMYAYNPTRKQQSCTWLEVGEQRHEKLMLVAFWDSRGVVHREFVPQGRAVNA